MRETVLFPYEPAWRFKLQNKLRDHSANEQIQKTAICRAV